MNEMDEIKLIELSHSKTNYNNNQMNYLRKSMFELNRLKKILKNLGYLDVYLNIYLKNTKKKDNLKNIREYIHQNLDVWLRDGHRL